MWQPWKMKDHTTGLKLQGCIYRRCRTRQTDELTNGRTDIMQCLIRSTSGRPHKKNSYCCCWVPVTNSVAFIDVGPFSTQMWGPRHHDVMDRKNWVSKNMYSWICCSASTSFRGLGLRSSDGPRCRKLSSTRKKVLLECERPPLYICGGFLRSNSVNTLKNGPEVVNTGPASAYR